MSARIITGLLTLALSSFAQSTIQGIVKDTTGGVMASVAVQATSPALIEKARVVLTNAQGRYEIADLRPGTYSLTFSAPGFKTVRRDNVELPADVSLPVYVEMSVGNTSETVEVRAAPPVVDVQSTTHSTFQDREYMDQVPSARNFQQLAGLTPGVRLTTPDVGGSQQMEQTYIVGHGPGNTSYSTTVLLDGMFANSNYLDGLIQNYIDDQIVQETTYVTSGVTAEVASGGVLVNMVPKDGGNEFHGAAFAGGTFGQGPFWQASNVTKQLQDRGLVGAQVLEHIQIFDGSIGGPIKRDKLWFVGSSRYTSTFDSPPGIFYPLADGKTPDLSRPGIEEQWIASGTIHLTWQINSKMKFSGTYERNIKHKGHELTGVAVKPIDPSTSAQRRGGTLYYVAQGKWTYTATPRLLFDAGFTTNIIHYAVVYQPGQEQLPFTPQWYSGITKVDTALNIRYNAPGVQNFYLPDRRGVSGSVMYVSGSHTFKVGVQDGWGKNDQVSSINGDLQANYSNGVPVSVTVYNTPIVSHVRVDADTALYAQDKWTIRRLAITAGIRWEYQKASIEPATMPAGRFAPARSVPYMDCNTVHGMGCWKSWAPRLGLAYDVFGNGKTAVRAGFGKFNFPVDTSYLNNFNPVALTSENRTWTDPNHTGIPMDNEIGAAQNPKFGTLAAPSRTLDPNYKREYSLQYSAGVQHAIRQGISVGFNWFHSRNYNTQVTIDRSYSMTNDWTVIPGIVNPLTGEPLSVYNLNASALGRAHDYYQTNGGYHYSYNGFEVNAVARLPRGAFVTGGWTYDHSVTFGCSGLSFPITGTTPALVNSTQDPNALRFCDQFGGQFQNLGNNVPIPYRSEFKLAGNIPTIWGIQLSTALQVVPQAYKTVTWSITNTTRYPFDCSVPGCTPGALVLPAGVKLTNASETIPLVAPGSRFYDRLAQLDLGLRKVIRIRERMNVSPQLDVFNVFNSSQVLSETTALGTSGANTFTGLVSTFKDGGPGGVPQTMLSPRLLRLSVQFKF
jgi:hypothetical protein